MEKTKLGISVEMLAAATFGVALCGGYVSSIVLALYILLREENQWLKRMSVKAVATMMIFDVFALAIGVIDDVINWISSFVSLFDGVVEVYKLTSVVSLCIQVISIAQVVFLVVLAVKALKQETIKIPVVDNFINKYI